MYTENWFKGEKAIVYMGWANQGGCQYRRLVEKFMAFITSMFNGSTGSCKESRSRNQPPYPDTRIYCFSRKQAPEVQSKNFRNLLGVQNQ
jgi:hypothetical protein